MKPGIDYPGVAVAFFCHDGHNNFVFHKRSKNCRDQHGTWDCGGGGVEFGETLEEALFRELKEEYDCTGTIDLQLHPSAGIVTENDITKHWVVIPYVVRVNRDEVKINEPENVDEIGWFTLDSIPQPIHPGVQIDLDVNQQLLRQYIPSKSPA